MKKRRIKVQELADRFGVKRQTIHEWMRKYNRAYKHKYDPKDIQSVFDFYDYAQKQRYRPLL